MSLRVIQQFGVVTLQGRAGAGLRRFGVPPGGAFDQESLTMANALASRPLGDAAWELSMAQATFSADNPGIVSVVGARATIRYRADVSASSLAFTVEGGDEFIVEAPTEGARVYVTFGYVPQHTGRRLQLDEPLDSVTGRGVLRVIHGPQARVFPSNILDQEFKVSRTGNRVGIRLEPATESHRIELPSEPACVGAVQVSNDGTLILLGPDGPTIGGYPKVAVVASCDIGRAAQLRPGEAVRFEWCTLEEARLLGVEWRQRLERKTRMLRLAMTGWH